MTLARFQSKWVGVQVWLRIGLLVVFGLLWWVMVGEVKAAEGAGALALEYKVKGGYLYNFAKFIEWPAGEKNEEARSFVIGVLDGGEAFPVLQQLFVGKMINGRTVEVRAVTGEDAGKGVHILMVTRSSGKTPEEVRSWVGVSPVLLVGETEQFAERGGVVGFVREDESIRITLNLERAAEVGLKVSAKLASVARVVKNKPVK